MPIEYPVHPTLNQLRAFRDAQLADTEALAIDSHLGTCPECQAALESLSKDDLELRCRQAGPSVSCATPMPANSVASVKVGGPTAIVPADLADHPRYLILDALGAGGMGTVYKAKHKVMDRLVALKVIGHKLTDNPEAVVRFRREVRAAAQLTHPNIVAAHDAEQAGGTHFLVMEFVEGVSLAKFVQDGGPLPVHEACICIRQAALGLQHAFEKGMVHRDIKPHNLMRTPNGWVKILDFGLARFVSETRGADQLTQEGALMGTPDYLAPEQANDAHTADIRADVYSLGCTLYFLLTGKPPFPGGSVMQKLAAHLSKPVRPVRELRPEVPVELWHIMERMLAKRPQDRYQTPAEVAQALIPFLRPQAVPCQEQVRAVPASLAPTAPLAIPVTIPPQPPARRRWWPWAVAATVAVLLLGLLPLAYFLGPTVLRFATNQGVLVIETDDEAVEVKVKGQSATIVDPHSKREITVQAGDGEIEVQEKDGLKFFTKSFKMSRAGKEIVHVHYELAQAKPASRPRIDPKQRVPADSLERKTIPEYELKIAGNGDPKNAPPELVAIFGDSRFRAWANLLCVAYSPDGKTIAGGGYDQTVHLWDVETGKQVAIFEGHRAPVVRLAFSPDGKTLASCATEPIVRLWDVEKKHLKMTLVGHTDWVTDLAFHRDSKLLATVSNAHSDSSVKLWDVDTGNVVHTWIPHNKEVHSVAFSPDGTLLATAGDDKLIKLWNVKTQKLVKEMKGHNAIIFRALAFHPDGQTLLAADMEGLARLWEVASGEERETIKIAAGQTPSVAFSPDGKTLALATYDGTVVVYDSTGKHLLRKRTPPYYLRLSGIAFSPDSKTLAHGSWEAEVRLWNIEADEFRPHPGGDMGPLLSLDVSPDGRWVASGSNDRVVRIWDLQTGKVRYELKQDAGTALAVAFSPNGQLLASGGVNNKVYLWEVATGKLKKALTGHTNQVNCLAFSPDGKTLASGSNDNTAILWDVAAGTEIGALRGHKNRVDALVYSPDGKYVVTASRYEPGIRFWNSATRVEESVLEGAEAMGAQALAFRADGGLMIAGGYENDQRPFHVWDYNTRKKLRTVEPHSDIVTAGHFASNGTVVSAAADGTVCLWNPHSGTLQRPAIRLGPPGGWVCTAVPTPEGRHLVVANRNGTIYVLRLAEVEK